MHSFHYLGNRLRQEVTEDHVTFELLAGGDSDAQPLALTCGAGSAAVLAVGKPLVVERGKCQISTQ